jgi:hypothetical protein
MKRILSSMLAMVIALGCVLPAATPAVAIAPVTPPPGLISWWPGEDNCDDIADGNHGTLQGGAQYAAGKVGKAFKFDGIDDYVHIDDALNLRPKNLTIEGWFKLNQTPIGFRTLVAKTLGTGWRESFVIFLDGNEIKTLSGDLNNSNQLNYTLNPIVGQWYHIVYTFDDDSNTNALYLDGVKVASASGSAAVSITYDDNPITIGAEWESGSLNYFFPGQADEVSFYNRALSDNEIWSIYNAGSAGKSINYEGTWTPQQKPSIKGSVLAGVKGDSSVGVSAIAVGSDSNTIYVTTNVKYGTPGTREGYIMKSTDGGQSFYSIENNYAKPNPDPGCGIPWSITVAADDIDTVAVQDGSKVAISHNGGATWQSLPSPVATGEYIAKIAIGPARLGTLLGRDYLVATASGNALQFGDIKIIDGTSWSTAGGGPNSSIAGVFDFTSVAVSPNFINDRTVVAVGTKAAAGSTALLIINTASKTVMVGAGNPVTGTLLQPTGNTVGCGEGLTEIRTSFIALPSDFNPAMPSGRRTYVGLMSSGQQNDNDVYRVDNDTSRSLNFGPAVPLNAIAYSGTIGSGILFAGPAVTSNTPLVGVKYTTSMTSSSPIWTTTLKGPSGEPGKQYVSLTVASDYVTTKRVFAATWGEESAFSISYDAGVSFVQEALINIKNIGTPGLNFTPDAQTIFLHGRDSSGYGAVWQSAVPFDATSWKRIFISNVFVWYFA